MYTYCNNNTINAYDPCGYAAWGTNTVAMCDGGSGYGPNVEFLMAFYGVTSPSEIPEMPDGAMIFVENITSVSNKAGLGIVEGRTIVMDAYRYCEYTFVGIGRSVSKSIALDRTVTQGYVYGLESVDDYCGRFVGGSANLLSTAAGGAIASLDVYAEITGGMGYAPSVGVSVTWYRTAQTNWIYGRANMVVLTNPYHTSPFGSTQYI